MTWVGWRDKYGLDVGIAELQPMGEHAFVLKVLVELQPPDLLPRLRRTQSFCVF